MLQVNLFLNLNRLPIVRGLTGEILRSTSGYILPTIDLIYLLNLFC